MGTGRLAGSHCLAPGRAAEADEACLLDRLFAIRYHDSRLYLPQAIPVVAALVASLRGLHKQQAAERLAAGQAYQDSGYVVCDELGAPVNPEWYSDEFHRVRERAGVRRIRLHDARRTINSIMAAAGVPDHIRAAWCGHRTEVNVGTYTTARPEDLASASAAVGSIFKAM